MSSHPTNPALEAAIVAHADEDTPRLAYADWLDEHGDPDRAAFIRAQCRLADMPPNDPEWVDLRDEEDELLVRLGSRRMGEGLSRANRFYFCDFTHQDFEEPFRRGFPYSIDYQTYDVRLKPHQAARMIEELTRLVAETTIRGFHPYELPQSWLAELLAAPVAAHLAGLSLTPLTTGRNEGEQVTAFHRLLAASPSLGHLRDLGLYGTLGAGSIGALAESTTLGSVRRLVIQQLEAPEATVRKLTGAAWFRRLWRFRTELPRGAVAVPMATGLGELPELRTLDLADFVPEAVGALAVGKFRSLARLLYRGPLDPDSTRTLAGARFPALVAFEGSGSAGAASDAAVRELLKADWFERLRVLDLSNDLTDRGVKALAAHPVTKSLRVLKLADNKFGKGGLTALAKRGAFPALTTLVLGSVIDTYNRRNNTAADLAAFLAALRLPRLRHLDLEGWPLGNAGAKALAANPAFAGLTRLNLGSCFIGDSGAKAIFASPHLCNLVELKMDANRIKSGADALADPGVMPRLAECRLNHNKIPDATAKRLKRKRPALDF